MSIICQHWQHLWAHASTLKCSSAIRVHATWQTAWRAQQVRAHVSACEACNVQHTHPTTNNCSRVNNILPTPVLAATAIDNRPWLGGSGSRLDSRRCFMHTQRLQFQLILFDPYRSQPFILANCSGRCHFFRNRSTTEGRARFPFNGWCFTLTRDHDAAW